MVRNTQPDHVTQVKKLSGKEKVKENEQNLIRARVRVKDLDCNQYSLEHEVKVASLRQLYRQKACEEDKMQMNFAKKLQQAQIQALAGEGERKHYNKEAAAKHVTSRAVDKLSWLAEQGVAVDKLQRIVLEYYSKKDHKILKVKSKKFMLALCLATLQCTQCMRWFTHEATLRQHIKQVHEEGLGVKPVYHQLLMSKEGLESSALPLCVLCQGHQNDDKMFAEDWPYLAYHYLHMHPDKLSVLGLDADWLHRDVLLELCCRCDVDPQFLFLDAWQRPLKHELYKHKLGELLAIDGEDDGDTSHQLKNKRVKKLEVRQSAAARSRLSQLPELYTQRLLENEIGQLMPNLEYDSITCSLALPASHRELQLECYTGSTTIDNEVTLQCFEKIPRFRHDQGPMDIALYDLRYLELEQLRRTGDQRAAYLMYPDSIVKRKDHLLLMYKNIGKPISTIVMATKTQQAYMIGIHLPPRTLWVQQLLCAVKALELLHENRKICGAFNLENIVCVASGADAKLFTLHLRADGLQESVVRPDQKSHGVARTRQEDILAAALTYCKLRLSDQATDKAAQSVFMCHDKSSDDAEVVFERLFKEAKKHLVFLGGEEAMFQELQDSQLLKLDPLRQFLEAQVADLQPSLVWRRDLSLSNFGRDPTESTDLRTQQVCVAPGAMAEYMTRDKKRAQRRERERRIELKAFERGLLM